MRYEVMATVRVLGASFLYTAGVDERRRLARRDLAFHFHPSHFLELHQVGLRALCSAQRYRGQYQGGHTTSDQSQLPYTHSHISLKNSPFSHLDASRQLPQVHYYPNDRDLLARFWSLQREASSETHPLTTARE
jgi:hypothetical protein